MNIPTDKTSFNSNVILNACVIAVKSLYGGVDIECEMLILGGNRIVIARNIAQSDHGVWPRIPSIVYVMTVESSAIVARAAASGTSPTRDERADVIRSMWSFLSSDWRMMDVMIESKWVARYSKSRAYLAPQEKYRSGVPMP